MHSNTHLEKEHRHATTAFVAGAAVFAFFAQPVLPFADPLDVFCAGGIFACVVVLVWTHSLQATTQSRQIFLSLVITAAMLLVIFQLIPAVEQAEANDRRCRLLEQEMIASTGRRVEIAALFSAVKCRPQLTERFAIPPEA